MVGIYGNHPEDRYFSNMLNKHLSQYDEPEVTPEELARQKFEDLGKPLPRWNDRLQIQDAIDDMTFGEFKSLAKALNQKDMLLAGEILKAALMRVCLKEAEWEIHNETF